MERSSSMPPVAPTDALRRGGRTRRSRRDRVRARAVREAGAVTGRDAGASSRAALGGAFDRALEAVTMAFQPIVRCEGGELYGYEALMRSSEPALPNPLAVLGAAEQLGRLHELGRHLRGLAAAPMASADERVTLFVNLHPEDLRDEMLASSTSPLDPFARRVVFEITERATLDQIPESLERVAALRARGYRIAIDDLGAGYAGLTSFVQLEPDLVKFDMSLVRDIDRSATKQRLVAAMSAVCHEMGLSVVAEGVETVEERDTLRGLGCDLLQGYLFARPAPPFPTARWP